MTPFEEQIRETFHLSRMAEASMLSCKEGRLEFEVPSGKAFRILAIALLVVVGFTQLEVAWGTPWHPGTFELAALGAGHLLVLGGVFSLLRWAPRFPTRIRVRESHGDGYRSADVHSLIQIDSREEGDSAEMQLIARAQFSEGKPSIHTFLRDPRGRLHSLWNRTSNNPDTEFTQLQRFAKALGVDFTRAADTNESWWTPALMAIPFGLGIIPMWLGLFSMGTNILLFIQVIVSGVLWGFCLIFLPLHRAAKRSRRVTGT